MNAADFLIAATLAVTLVLGLVRGFLREAIGILGWLCGLWLAWRYAPLLAQHLGGELAAEPLRTWVARGIIVVGVLLIAWLVAAIAAYFAHHSGLSESVDRLLGGFLGLLRGVVLVAIFAMVAQKARLDEMSWWKQSKLLPQATMISGWIAQFAESAQEAVDKRRSDVHSPFAPSKRKA
jgi:membrane protein required for colicin V production